MIFKNDKVICINAEGIDKSDFIRGKIPKHGGIYNVRGIYIPKDPEHPTGLYLTGFEGKLNEDGIENAFREKRFQSINEYRLAKTLTEYKSK